MRTFKALEFRAKCTALVGIRGLHKGPIESLKDLLQPTDNDRAC